MRQAASAPNAATAGSPVPAASAAAAGNAGTAAGAGAAGNGGAGTASDELAKLAGLHQRGVLNDEEFARAKSRVV